MKKTGLTRRDFQNLSLAAAGGLLIGAGGTSEASAAQDKRNAQDKDDDKNPLLVEPHVCRGLNACAGLSACATAEAHDCKGQNACKGQGGCGARPGENACKGMGDCAVPLTEKKWKTARARFEQLMKTERKEFGKAPTTGKAKS
ncbi:MAG: hypothetical protein WD847_18840 [Pirellulales bacterium]